MRNIYYIFARESLTFDPLWKVVSEIQSKLL